jgi:hypothetical protein
MAHIVWKAEDVVGSPSSLNAKFRQTVNTSITHPDSLGNCEGCDVVQVLPSTFAATKQHSQPRKLSLIFTETTRCNGISFHATVNDPSF